MGIHTFAKLIALRRIISTSECLVPAPLRYCTGQDVLHLLYAYPQSKVYDLEAMVRLPRNIDGIVQECTKHLVHNISMRLIVKTDYSDIYFVLGKTHLCIPVESE